MKLLRGVHFIAHHALRAAGFRWELRRTGDLKIGLWRKSWKKNGAPKRLILVPGFGDTPLTWLPIVASLTPLLKRRYDELVIFDFPGFSGFLSNEKFFHSIDLLRDAVGDIFDSLKP